MCQNKIMFWNNICVLFLKQHADDFNTTAALYELYKYIQQYYEDVSMCVFNETENVVIVAILLLHLSGSYCDN
jgi:hypothetical protein